MIERRTLVLLAGDLTAFLVFGLLGNATHEHELTIAALVRAPLFL